MENNAVYTKVTELISRYTNNADIAVTPDTNVLKDLGLVSMDFTDLICDFEEEFGGIIPERDLRRLVKVSDIVEYIQNMTA